MHGQKSIKNSVNTPNTEFHENPTNGSVADAMIQETVPPHAASYYVVNNALKIRAKMIKCVGKEENEREEEDCSLLVCHIIWKKSIEVSEKPDASFHADDGVRLI